jgi:hypothetical protein
VTRIEQTKPENFVSGRITAGETWGAPKNPDYIFPIAIHKGKRLFMKPEDAPPNFTAEDVFIKGANAVDPDGRAGYRQQRHGRHDGVGDGGAAGPGFAPDNACRAPRN